VPEAADQPPTARSGRSLAGFYLAVGVAAALLGLGAWLYRPMRLLYAIHRIESGALADRRRHSDETCLAWTEECCRAAQRGHPRALRALETALLQEGPAWQVKRKVLAVLTPEEMLRQVLGSGQPYLLATGSYSVYCAGLTEADWALRDRLDIDQKVVTPVGCVMDSDEEARFRGALSLWTARYNRLVMNHCAAEQARKRIRELQAPK